jgi:UDP-N-acetylglucosamine 4,6-dehydratase
MMISVDDARHVVDLGDRYAIEPAFVEFSRESFAGAHPQVAEGFSYASDTNEEWLSHEGLLRFLAGPGASAMPAPAGA